MAGATPRRFAAVGFDFDHTLGIDNKLERVAFLRLLDIAARHGGTYLGTLAEEIGNIDDLLVRQRSGRCSIEDAVEQFMRDRGIANAHRFVDVYKHFALEGVEQFVVPEPGVAAVLSALRDRAIPCAILTNGWSPLQQRKAHRVGFYGTIIVSSDIGVQKPDAAAFHILAEALGVSPSEVAFVGDTPASDVAGAVRAGMNGVWFDAEGASYPDDLPPPSEVIHSLTELLAFV